MLSIREIWVGHFYGTNTGKLFVKLTGEDVAVSAAVHVNDDDRGPAAFEAAGRFENGALILSAHVPDNPGQTLDIVATLDQSGNLKGGWTSNFGPAGTLTLFPSNAFDRDTPDQTSPAQLYTSRRTFGPVVIGREQLIAIAREMQKVFTASRLVMTVNAGTEQIFFLDMFDGKHFAHQRAEIVKLHVQEPDRDGLNRMISLEFGPSYNIATAQGTDEAWVIGRIEILKNLVTPLMRGYALRLKSPGIGFNQILLVGTIVLLPSVDTILDRLYLVIGVIAIAIFVKILQDKIFQNAVIYIGERTPSVYERVWPPILSTMIAVLGGAAATLLAAFIQGWFGR